MLYPMEVGLLLVCVYRTVCPLTKTVWDRAPADPGNYHVSRHHTGRIICVYFVTHVTSMYVL